MFNSKDLKQIKDRGSDPERVEAWLGIFKNGVAPAQLDRACAIGDGIVRLNDVEQKTHIDTYEEARRMGRFQKMVPASGAATRMFKSLYAAESDLSQGRENPDAAQFLENLPHFAFFDHLKAALKDSGQDLDQLQAQGLALPIIKTLLEKDGLNYGQLPKGLLAFHKYPDEIRTPAQEQLHEAIAHIADDQGRVRIHFTVSPEHMQAFKVHLAQASQERSEIQWDITYSVQKPGTDTLAVNPDHTPFRLESGELLFRPGGHGALIENLNDLQADLVFLKNIDNVTPDRLRAPTIHYKKALGGYLIQLQNQVFNHLEWLEQNPLTPAKRDEILHFIQTALGFQPHNIESDLDTARTWLFNLLNRPLRVCGMVKNEGEPGGGPYWVRDHYGVSLQIVETSQMDLANPHQKNLVANATHFNPVDLVCAVRDYKGKPFNLTAYTDPNSCFISQKSLNSKPLLALELPGLWNGAMARWNTGFVETPLSTFSPVKTVFDLLRDQHRA